MPYSHICITNLALQLFSSFVHFRWSAEPGLQCIQVHFEEESPPRNLITFHTCVGGKLASK